MLESNPGKKSAYITDTTTDLDNAILIVAIRGVATYEMLIPKGRCDPAQNLAIVF